MTKNRTVFKMIVNLNFYKEKSLTNCLDFKFSMSTHKHDALFFREQISLLIDTQIGTLHEIATTLAKQPYKFFLIL